MTFAEELDKFFNPVVSVGGKRHVMMSGKTSYFTSDGHHHMTPKDNPIPPELVGVPLIEIITYLDKERHRYAIETIRVYGDILEKCELTVHELREEERERLWEGIES